MSSLNFSLFFCILINFPFQRFKSFFVSILPQYVRLCKCGCLYVFEYMYLCVLMYPLLRLFERTLFKLCVSSCQCRYEACVCILFPYTAIPLSRSMQQRHSYRLKLGQAMRCVVFSLLCVCVCLCVREPINEC